MRSPPVWRHAGGKYCRNLDPPPTAIMPWVPSTFPGGCWPRPGAGMKPRLLAGGQGCCWDSQCASGQCKAQPTSTDKGHRRCACEKGGRAWQLGWGGRWEPLKKASCSICPMPPHHALPQNRLPDAPWSTFAMRCQNSNAKPGNRWAHTALQAHPEASPAFCLADPLGTLPCARYDAGTSWCKAVEGCIPRHSVPALEPCCGDADCFAGHCMTIKDPFQYGNDTIRVCSCTGEHESRAVPAAGWLAGWHRCWLAGPPSLPAQPARPASQPSSQPACLPGVRAGGPGLYSCKTAFIVVLAAGITGGLLLSVSLYCVLLQSGSSVLARPLKDAHSLVCVSHRGLGSQTERSAATTVSVPATSAARDPLPTTLAFSSVLTNNAHG